MAPNAGKKRIDPSDATQHYVEYTTLKKSMIYNAPFCYNACMFPGIPSSGTNTETGIFQL